jgi:hypothetical protein
MLRLLSILSPGESAVIFAESSLAGVGAARLTSVYEKARVSLVLPSTPLCRALSVFDGESEKSTGDAWAGAATAAVDHLFLSVGVHETGAKAEGGMPNREAYRQFDSELLLPSGLSMAD